MNSIERNLGVVEKPKCFGAGTFWTKVSTLSVISSVILGRDDLVHKCLLIFKTGLTVNGTLKIREMCIKVKIMFKAWRKNKYYFSIPITRDKSIY